jgi:hypothetical protein
MHYASGGGNHYRYRDGLRQKKGVHHPKTDNEQDCSPRDQNRSRD